ncbi:MULTISPECIES: glycoside hydrolase family 16 protein [Ramlibacter]|uniref:Family 16 glycosylhydrolase n=1 Tax=Ramlibacter pinisoli TaxID=2682844 RepID=A0A6N8IRB5_9BURK|nr:MULTISPECIES: glycoside hydrolase family 16 protein [Ramlibacter]MBA2964421.1 glycoside hydrolase family 16 protein [Ramlibacter sp. CGMCC 1.13660]MVQ29387.1 family 16 glycosylhydrolase [Ramlibacter pinisoli]
MAGWASRVRGPVMLLAALAAGPAVADWTLEHESSFASGRGIDPAYWRLETGFLRNREDQYYSDANAQVQGGVLRLEARREEVPNAQWKAGSRDWRVARRSSTYTSASLLARKPLQYGRVEVVARTPSGAGVWPAIWLLHEGERLYGEIDVFEAVGKHPDTVFAGVHHGREPRTRQHRNDSRVVPGFEGSWHTHTLEWTPGRIRVALDGQPWFSFDPQAARLPDGADPLRQPMRLRINLALGGSWGGPIDDSRLPARFDIASIRIWRWTPGAGDALPAPAAVPAAATVDGGAAASAAAPAPAPAPTPGPAAGSGTMRWGR